MDSIETNTGAEPVAAPPAGATRGYTPQQGIGGSGQPETPANAASGSTLGPQSPASNQGSPTGGSEAPTGATTGGAVSGGATDTQEASGARPENLEQEVARLRDQVQRLEAEVDTLRREDTGTGGSGTQTTASDADTDSTVLASVVMQGRVASVGEDRVVVRDAESGDTFNLFVTNTTRISANGKRVSPKQLSAGTPVQAAFNYIADGDTYATQIQAYPGRGR
ncbi:MULTISPECIES: bZIP transcription factor [unclassified Myxococcus]|uniref:bZIP transcription factor n=1 Tax=unclassified Myxococcus TaxID=2648731 RepID=UPI0020CD5713|nr:MULTISPECIES: bZIP transcription factor [unclassified Myxococcus]